MLPTVGQSSQLVLEANGRNAQFPATDAISPKPGKSILFKDQHPAIHDNKAVSQPTGQISFVLCLSVSTRGAR